MTDRAVFFNAIQVHRVLGISHSTAQVGGGSFGPSHSMATTGPKSTSGSWSTGYVNIVTVTYEGELGYQPTAEGHITFCTPGLS